MTDKKEDFPGKSPRRGTSKRGVLLAILLWLALVLIFGLNWRRFSTYIFYGEYWTNEDFFRNVEGTIDRDYSPTSLASLRLPIPPRAEAYITLPEAQYPEDGSRKYSVRVIKGEQVEVGLVRLRKGYSCPSWKYTFSVYERKSGKRRKLIQETGNFPLHSLSLFRIAEKLNGHGRDGAEIEYVIKPKGLRPRLASWLATLMGGAPYHEDFVFVPPNTYSMSRPDELNVILVSFDTLRPDRLSCFGHSRPTSSHIDSFAEQGVLFTQAFSSSPWTLPAHFSLITGLYPSAQLTVRKDVRKYRYYADRPIAAILQDNGYYTIGITGGLHLTSVNGFALGFDRYTEFHFANTDSTRRVFQGALDWLEGNRDMKFFMFLHNYECHFPYRNTYFLDKGNFHSLIEQRKALYDGGVRSADAYFGELIEKLKSLDLLSKTMVVVVSDHGDDLHDHFTERDRIPRISHPVPERGEEIDHGHSLYDEVIRILILFYLPGFEPERRVVSNQVRIIDVIPTVLDYLGIQSDGPIQGVSLMELMKNGTRQLDPPAISEFTLYGPERKSVRMNGYKYIYIPDPHQRKDGISFADIPKHALFDLRKDTRERDNIYAKRIELGKEYHATLGDILRDSQEIRTELQARIKMENEESTELPDDVVNALKAIGYL